MNFDEAVNVFLEESREKWKKRTEEQQKRIVNKHLLPAFSGMDIQEITVRRVSKWMRNSDSKPIVMNRAKVLLGEVLRHSGVDIYFPIKLENDLLSSAVILSDDEILRLGHAMNFWVDRDISGCSIVRLCLLTGCRPSEMRRVLWRDVYEDRIFVIAPRGKKREVLLPGAATDIFRELPGRKGRNAHGFPRHRSPDAWPSAALQSSWGRLKKKAGLPRARLQDLRHTYALFAIRRGIEPHVVRGILHQWDRRLCHAYAKRGGRKFKRYISKNRMKKEGQVPVAIHRVGTLMASALGLIEGDWLDVDFKEESRRNA